jgi:hypothetical protein
MKLTTTQQVFLVGTLILGAVILSEEAQAGVPPCYFDDYEQIPYLGLCCRTGQSELTGDRTCFDPENPNNPAETRPVGPSPDFPVGYTWFELTYVYSKSDCTFLLCDGSTKPLFGNILIEHRKKFVVTQAGGEGVPMLIERVSHCHRTAVKVVCDPKAEQSCSDCKDPKRASVFPQGLKSNISPEESQWRSYYRDLPCDDGFDQAGSSALEGTSSFTTSDIEDLLNIPLKAADYCSGQRKEVRANASTARSID